MSKKSILQIFNVYFLFFFYTDIFICKHARQIHLLTMSEQLLLTLFGDQ